MTVELQDVTPPDPVKPAFNEVNEARQDKERTINQAQEQANKEIPKARGVAAQSISQAEGYALERVNRASGDANRFNAILDEYKRAPEVTRRRLYLESLAGFLAEMKGVKEHRVFITAAATADEEAAALYLRVQAQMMSYFSKSHPVERFLEIRGRPYLLTKNRVIVGNAPLDHVLWTDRLSRAERAVSRAIGKMPDIRGKEIRVSGTVDPKALKALQNRGWKVKDRLQERLLKK